jgi:hypothetical protein
MPAIVKRNATKSKREGGSMLILGLGQSDVAMELVLFNNLFGSQGDGFVLFSTAHVLAGLHRNA